MSSPAWGLAAGSMQPLDATDAPDGTPFISEAFASIEETPTVESPELLNGVGRLLARARTDLRLAYSVTMRSASAEEIAALYGATVVTVTGGRKTLKRLPGDRPGPLKFVFVSGTAEGEYAGGWMKTIHKALVTTPMPISLSDADFSEFTFEIEAVKCAAGFVDDDESPVGFTVDDLDATP